MNRRERWTRCMHFQSVDYIPDEEFGYWDENFKIWQEQGLPKDINDNESAEQYFGFSLRSEVPVELELSPAFEPKVIEETNKYRIIIDEDGVKKKIFKGGAKGSFKYEHRYKMRIDENENESSYLS